MTFWYLVEHAACGYRWWGETLHPAGPCPSCGDDNPEWHVIPVVAAPETPKEAA
jgi:hypothetical protein